MNTPKNIYIFGNDQIGFLGFTDKKEYAKKILKVRSGLERFKIKYDDHCKDNLSINNEFIEVADNVFMTANEEEYYLESFSSFQQDVSMSCERLIEYSKIFRWKDDELEYINNLINYINDYIYYLMIGQYSEEDEDDGIFDTDKTLEYFMKYALNGEKL